MINVPAMVAALFRRKKKVWHAVGYADYSWSQTFPDKPSKNRDLDGRMVFLVSEDGERKIMFPHENDIKGANFINIKLMYQSNAWVQGAPLPDEFTPLQGPERKPWKVPEQIRGQFNKEK